MRLGSASVRVGEFSQLIGSSGAFANGRTSPISPDGGMLDGVHRPRNEADMARKLTIEAVRPPWARRVMQ